MLDWLRRHDTPETVLVGGRALPLAIRRLDHARRLTLRLAPDGREVRITMPRWARTADAVAFARARADWLATQLERLAPPSPPAPDGTIAFRGAPHRIRHDPAAARLPRAADGELWLGGPAEGIHRRLERWLKAEGRALLAADLADYTARAGVALPALALSSARARWGSCSAGGVVRLNWRLVMAPDFVRRSVVAHEVAHLVHFNHSPRFHALLGQIFEGDLAEANRWLKREGRALYLPFG